MGKVALYNFLSTFSGTHFIEPRSVVLKIGFVFVKKKPGARSQKP